MYVDQSYSLKRNFFLEFHWLFEKFKEIITNVAFFGNFVLKFLPSQKKTTKKTKLVLTGNICSAYNLMQMVAFFKNVLIL